MPTVKITGDFSHYGKPAVGISFENIPWDEDGVLAFSAMSRLGIVSPAYAAYREGLLPSRNGPRTETREFACLYFEEQFEKSPDLEATVRKVVMGATATVRLFKAAKKEYQRLVAAAEAFGTSVGAKVEIDAYDGSKVRLVKDGATFTRFLHDLPSKEKFEADIALAKAERLRHMQQYADSEDHERSISVRAGKETRDLNRRLALIAKSLENPENDWAASVYASLVEADREFSKSETTMP